MTGVKWEPAPGFGTDPRPTSAASEFPPAKKEWAPVIRHAIRFPAKSGTGDDDPVAVAGKIGETVTVFGIIRRIVGDVLDGIVITLQNSLIAVGGPLIEIIGRGVQINADLIGISAADVEGVAFGDFCFAGFGFHHHIAGEDSHPAIALRRINSEASGLLHDYAGIWRVN